MDSIISSVTQSLLNKALDVTTANHRIIANNIANVDSVNYSPAKLDFDAVMSQVSDMVNHGASDEAISRAVKEIDPNFLPTVQEAGAKVMLDKEMVALTDNSLRYQSLIMAKKGFGGLLKTAIKGGRG
ncbi:MAG: hypothetical protein MI867_29455 [Pseudomonadales bacterium]|nr:hypothetical protein [Pseudomonadales bacterium]